ncbi:MAG: TSUP family transporter [Candidatus Cloacimonadales bacterium]|jgi:uncharacterized membrane protein YfcA|nr:TSUP family transporter [Candidatus Cloacimonadota bacterium]MDD2650517.1 TSUP family transporter [Candidatus Cloacimonadota bacterium]MDD3501482.1 TSUP family transporter [Candidatus Cloacimonadota bacterium]MDX9976404.1 TSUP family transporter [Candidatus Cloacimonadales bacterium]
MDYQITYNTFLIILPLIFLGGLIDSIAGGGGLISLPAYMIAGLPTHVALGNNKFSSCWGSILSTIRFFKHGMIDVKVALPSVLFALFGSFLGTRTVLLLNPDFLHYILIILLPIITVFSLVKKNIGLNNQSNSYKLSCKIMISALIALIIGFYDGFFGPGTGTFLIFAYTLILKYDFVTANGNAKVINSSSNIAALIGFLLGGKIILLIGIPAAISGIIGNYLGSKLVVKKGSKFIRPIFILVFILLFLKIVYDLISNS